MWPFTTSPEHRLRHRVLKRLRQAYLVTEDLTARHYIKDNLRLLDRGLRAARDDAVLYEHWKGTPLSRPQQDALALEERLWRAIGDQLHDLDRQGFHPDAFEKEAAHLHDIATALQDVLQAELEFITHPNQDDRRTARIRARIAHYLVTP